MGKHDVESWLIPGNLGQESTRSPLDSDCWTFDWAPEMSEQSWQKSDVYPITICLLYIYIYLYKYLYITVLIIYTTHHVYVQICLNPRDICIDTKQLHAEYTQDISTYVHICVLACLMIHESHIWYIYSHASLDSRSK